MAKGRDSFTKRIEKKAYIEKKEAEGKIADSMEVRIELIRRAESGEITLAEMKKELDKIKRAAKKNGQMTRAQAWRKG